ncbi:MAG: NUDIX domain-containing protein [Myxococcales bacterium]|nr:NUDIX domain-containing protein [Myxococcales bacterium]
MDLHERYAVRGLLLSPTNELLLIKTQTRTGIMWLAPGGGIEAQEEPREALIRELYEELGYTLDAAIVEVWRRQFTYTSTITGPTRQNERYFLIHTKRFSPTFENVPEAREQQAMLQAHWWTLKQISEASDLRFAPQNLAEVFGDLLKQVPTTPITVEISM